MIDSAYYRVPGAKPALVSAFLKKECAKLHANGTLFSRMREWDSKHFGVGVGSIDYLDSRANAKDLNTALEWLKKNGAKCVFARPPASDASLTALLEKAGFRVMDCLATFGGAPRDGAEFEETANEAAKIGAASQADERGIRSIAANAFQFDHFHADSRFPKTKSDSLFAEWAADCLHKKTVLVERGERGQRTSGGVEGFVTCGFDSFLHFGRIDLIAVKTPRKGIGRRLVEGALSWFHGKTSFVLVGTQTQNPATRLYHSAGLAPLFAQYSMHCWL